MTPAPTFAPAEAAAKALAIEHETGGLRAEFPEDLRPTNLAEAYQVQDLLVARLGRRRVGWKIGATNDAAQAQLGFPEPVRGALLDGALLRSPLAVAPSFFPGGGVGIECEIALTMAADLPPASAPHSEDTVRAAVATAAPCLELPGLHFADLAPIGYLSLVADNFGAHAVATGEPVPLPRLGPLADVPMRLTVNGELTAEGSGAAVLGDPIRALTWLVNHLAARGIALEAGELVSSGAIGGLVPLHPGDVVVADYGPLGAVELTIGAS